MFSRRRGKVSNFMTDIIPVIILHNRYGYRLCQTHTIKYLIWLNKMSLPKY